MTQTTVVTIDAFLLARFAEDVAAARASLTDYCDTIWRVDDGLGVVDQFDSVLVYREGDEPLIHHIARWDPARVLAECEAKRRIVELHRIGGDYTPGGAANEGFRYCATCGSGEPYEYPTKWPCDTLRLLAAPYADHPEYREEWKV